MAIFAVYAATAWPVWAALNSNVGRVVSNLCGTLTIGLGVYTAYLLITMLRRAAPAEVMAPEAPEVPEGTKQLVSVRS
jgi:hypothetical protein